MDEEMIGPLVKRIVDEILGRLALAETPGDGSGGVLDGPPDLGGDPALDLNESGIGPAQVPAMIGGKPKPGGGPPPAGDGEGEPVLDDLDDDSGGGTGDEDDDMDEDEKKPVVGKYQSDEAVQRAIREAVDAVTERYSSDLRAASERIASLEADKETNRREAILRGLADDEGIEFNAEAELKRTAKYSAGGFDGHVQIMRENYRRREEAERDGFIPTGEVPSAEDGDAIIAGMIRSARASEVSGLTSPSEIAAAAFERYQSERKAVRG